MASCKGRPRDARAEVGGAGREGLAGGRAPGAWCLMAVHRRPGGTGKEVPCPPGWTLACSWPFPPGTSWRSHRRVSLCGSWGRAYSLRTASWSLSDESPGQGCAHASRGGRAGKEPGGRCPHLEGGWSQGAQVAGAPWEPGGVGGADTPTSRSLTVGWALVVADTEGPGDPAPHRLPQESNRGPPSDVRVHLTLSLTLTFPRWLPAQRVSQAPPSSPALPPTGGPGGGWSLLVWGAGSVGSASGQPRVLWLPTGTPLTCSCWQDTWCGPPLPPPHAVQPHRRLLALPLSPHVCGDLPGP